MPANKSNHSTPSKENNNNGKQPINGRKKRSANLKHKKHSRTYLLHSEYRSTYTWHEYTGPNQEHTVVRRAPQAPPTKDAGGAKLQSAKSIEDENNEGTSLEPPLPRRKKCPELAYRTHEFISSAAQQHANIQTADGGGLVGGVGGGGIDALDSNVVADKVREVTKTLPASQLSKAITRISTEYRLQFAWPRRQQHQLTNGEIIAHSKDEALSNEQQQQVPRNRRDGVQASELEPLVRMDGALPEADEQDELDAVELKLTLKKSAGNRAVRIAEQPGGTSVGEFRKTQERPFSATEVIELRRELKRLADEYKHRDWGGGMATEEDEATLWKRVSNNHALNALSLARSATKEEKEKENTRKVGPAAAVQAAQVAPAGRPSSTESPEAHLASKLWRLVPAESTANGVQSPHQQVSQAVESPHPPQPGWIDDEPVVKSPPEPTRVKSPEQMIMRSPEPVNWTVPLDTGKTFTVTQNVREDSIVEFKRFEFLLGEPPTRAHSEARSWVGLAPQSASQDPQKQLKLTEHKQQQQQQQQQSGYKSPESESVSLGSFSGTNGHKEQEDSLAERDSPLATIVKDEEAPHCLEEPIFEFESKIKMEGSDAGTASQPAAPQEQHATDLLEKARNRFDKFWGSGKGSEQ
ncbi:hypothetical protein TSAR_016640 [Trichomalopsis sarcophagae]|uniref:Nuclear protein MDM1 n=1 Tax=Trichomalopsis sarcophagae TaxID=543379 RepID=A0A232ELN7_9HYME|nr:hypothetical protein TSAR_016640 [Trichomalopsis sarcophagae]